MGCWEGASWIRGSGKSRMSEALAGSTLGVQPHSTA